MHLTEQSRIRRKSDMEYIYCKDSDELNYTMRTLERMGYESKLELFPLANFIDEEGMTIFVSDKRKIISGEWIYGFYTYGCKPSKFAREKQIYPSPYNINEIMDTGAWKELKKHLNTEPLDDTEELEQDRERLRKFAKDTKGKAKISLVPMQILTDVAEVREYGVKKYGSVDSYKEVPIEDYRDALLRHIIEYIKDPSGVDSESGIKHYKHIACNMAFICEMESKDDDPTSI